MLREDEARGREAGTKGAIRAVASDNFMLNTDDAKEVQIGDISGLNKAPDLSGKGDA